MNKPFMLASNTQIKLYFHLKLGFVPSGGGWRAARNMTCCELEEYFRRLHRQYRHKHSLWFWAQ